MGLREAQECVEAQDKMHARASECDCGRAQFVVNVVYGSHRPRDEELESAPAQDG